MNRSIPKKLPTALLLGLAASGCSSATGAAGPGAEAPAPYDRPNPAHTTQATPTPGRYPYTQADVAFMAGMIRHHAQAVLISGWAPTHGASGALLAMCERIVVGQQDEIALASRWLRKKNEPVPETDHALMSGMDHATMMPGMLTPEQLARLDAARGGEFDRIFLEYMIVHHQGAITMVDQLFGSRGAGQDETVFRFASDVYADQTTEIHRMQTMLTSLPPNGVSP